LRARWYRAEARPPRLRDVDATPTAPEGLTPATQAWFNSVVEEFEFSPSHLKLLLLAAETWDQIEHCNQLIARDGLIVAGRRAAGSAGLSTLLACCDKRAWADLPCQDVGELDPKPGRSCAHPDLDRRQIAQGSPVMRPG